MIKNNRPPRRPAALKAPKIGKTLKSLRAKARRGETITSKDIPSHWAAVRDNLCAMHHGKCCYCERKRDKAREPDVEHYRPKCEVTEDKTHPGYWWLAYDWSNLLWSCKSCNEDKKRNHFPIKTPHLRVRDEHDVAGESPLLLNPAMDDCEQFFLYEWKKAQEQLVTMHVKDGDERGKATRDILDLNRLELLKERGFYLQYVLKPIAIGLTVASDQAALHEKKQKYVSDLRRMISSDSEFTGLARAYFEAFHLSEHF